ncbi:MAG: hypothetical protein ACP5NZ_01625 [Nanobdellota archaeon]
MQIEFYEEFPNRKNLQKLKLINFPSKIFLAAKSLEEFQNYEKIAKSYKKDLKIAYWPIVKNSYWVSSFSNTKDLIKLSSELDTIKNSLLIDLELPLIRRWKMYLKNIFSSRRNKTIIRNFILKNKDRITTAEYPFASTSRLMKLIGLSYEIDYEKSIMWYSSMISKAYNRKIKKYIIGIKDKSNYSVSLGVIARGILGNENILSPKDLEKDIEFIKNAGFNKIIIFRLGGLNKEYVKILNKFASRKKI